MHNGAFNSMSYIKYTLKIKIIFDNAILYVIHYNIINLYNLNFNL
jgi:hypothetical protein